MHREPLTARQLEVLRWIADGCPDGVWPDDTHKLSARALETRNLAAVARRDGRWHARLKPDGAHYLAHGTYPHPPPTPTPPTPAATAAPAAARRRRVEIDVTDLLARLQAGPVRIEAPSAELRAAYRRAIHQATVDGLVPDGLTLRHSGRDHGDLVIRLVETPPATPTPAPVPIPDTYDAEQPAIRRLLANPSSWGVSPDARARALRLVQALADEAARRGYQLAEPADEAGTFRIDIGEDSFAFLLSEEHDHGEQIPADQLAAAKYSWQRVSPQPAMIASGRLTLELQRGWRPTRWADRRRWRLDDKLPAVLELIEQDAAQARKQREEAAAERRRRRELWEQAVPRAMERYVYDLNAERLTDQTRASAQAAEILAYCQRLAERAGHEPDSTTRRAIEQWAEWARSHAEAIDPLGKVDDLCHVEPTEAKSDDLDRYMPRGLTVRHPPDHDR